MRRVEQTKITKSVWKCIVSKTFLDNTGKQVVFDTFGPENQNHAGIVAVTKDKKVIVARQFRAGPQQVMWEIPGGTVEVGEDPIDAAKREMLEETGYSVGTIMKLGIAHKDAYMNATWHFFLALDCEKAAEQNLDETEDITIELISIDDFISNAINDRITDHAAVLMAYEQLKSF